MPKTPYDAVLHAARDLPQVGTALAAEMLGATLLGSVYTVAESERAGAVEEFVTGFLAHTARRRTDAARAARAVFAALVPQATGAERVRRGPDPAWLDQLGKVRLVGSWAYGDVFGDQTSYLASFVYHDQVSGGDEHAVVVLVDHNIGIVKDLFVGEPAGRLLEEVRKAADTDELVWLTEVDPASMRAQVDPYLAVTDGLATLPDGGSLATDRVLVGARLATLPPAAAAAPSPPVDPAAVVESFLGSAQASELAEELEREPDRRPAGDGARTQGALRYAVRLILEFAEDGPDGDPLRWSPAVVGLFLLDWLQRRAVLDADDVVILPRVLRAWVSWAGAQRGLSTPALAATGEAIDLMAPEFARLYSTGERRAPEVTAVARLLGDGVDPDDEAAVKEWLVRYSATDDLADGSGVNGSAVNGRGVNGSAADGDGSHQIPRPR